MTANAEKFIASVLEGTVKEYFKQGKVSHLFRSEGDQKLFEFFDQHSRTYGQFPSQETIENHTGIVLPVPPEPPAYYVEQLRRSYVEFGIRDAAKAAEGYLKPDSKDPDQALSALTTALSVLQFNNMAQVVSDYRDAGNLIKEAYKANWIGAGEELTFGWPTMDAMCGGIQEGDVISLVAATGLGKTFLALRMAEKAWEQGRVPLFVSMEVKPLPIFQRLAAIHTTKPMSGIKMGTLSDPIRQAFFAQMDALPDQPLPFYVVDGNLQASAHDIQGLVEQLKPGLLVLDGAYLMKHPTEKDRFRRIAENMDLIKQNLTNRCPVIATWQFNREGKKLKAGEKPGLNHIAGSDAIGTHSSLVLAAFEEESIETGNKRRLDVLKGRHGEIGSFLVNWRFEGNTNFDEVVSDPFEALGE